MERARRSMRVMTMVVDLAGNTIRNDWPKEGGVSFSISSGQQPFDSVDGTRTVERPAPKGPTDPGGLTPGQAGFAPSVRQTTFHIIIAYPVPLDQSFLVTLKCLSFIINQVAATGKRWI